MMNTNYRGIHHGFFGAKTGIPTAGPPKRPLPEVVVAIEDPSYFRLQS
ncbi:MAG: hypothetical protein WD469_07165 [Paenibacillaceae bacterium]